MKQRSILLAALAMMPFAPGMAQQIPPAKPTEPTTARPTVPMTAQPTPASPAEPALAGRLMLPLLPLLPAQGAYIDEYTREEIRRVSEEARLMGQLAAEDGRRVAEDARIDSREIAESARIAGQQAMADARIALQDLRVELPRFSVKPYVAALPFEGQPMFSGFGSQGPPPNFIQGDPADSLYQIAREAFNRQDYSRAAGRFADMMAKYPTSRLVAQAAYWQAFALYRVGTMESLRSSLKVIESNTSRFEYENSRMYKSDAPVLQARVLRALAQRKEPGVEEKLRELYAKYPAASCDQEAIGIQSQVLSSLYQTDPDAAMPYIRQHLATKDACNAELRRSALFLLANRPSEDQTALIVQVAKNDTVRSVRTRAIEMLSRMPGDGAIAALQQFMTDNDEQVQSAAVRSLMRSDNPKARAAMRSLIDRRDASDRQRLEAIRSYDRDNTTPDDAAYLRGLFNRAGESERIKDAVLSAIGQMPTEENMAFLLSVAKNANESSYLRSSALRRVTSRQNLATDDLIKLYDATDSRSMRNSLVDALGQRGEPAAINKLLDIVKLSTDPDVRSNAIQILLRKKDPVITQKVLDLIK